MPERKPRPLLKHYTSPTKPRRLPFFAREKREQTNAEQQRRLAVTHILEQGIPLLNKYVEKSPVEVFKEMDTIWSGKYTKILELIGGWPIGTVNCAFEGKESSYGGINVYEIIATEDYRVGVVDTFSNGYTAYRFSPGYLHPISDIGATGKEFGFATDPETIVGGISCLLAEVGIEFVLPS